ncbi:hypothetical protein C8A00DRAFT_36149 [Chaetomidium leptoderma]|uniref:Uncharacterized protein n=1 Tax=Chaetomidium leptoderma TaxID=669021 RepID=A0AAN6ZV38_9PEZI|nr:hypothetical protein C8A00DRAFT_36149 [Chaetomidium leptoderma]
MDKCWFALRYTHYTAPKYESPGMAYGEAEGPLRLGHLLPGPRAVDNIINASGVLSFPKDMRITKSDTVNFCYARRVERTIEGSAAAEAPITAAAGLKIAVDAGAIFRTFMGNTWSIDRLETQIMQPTSAYVKNCLESPEVASWIDAHKKLGAWKVYMITGLMIARGARNEMVESTEKGGQAGGGVDASGLAKAELGFHAARKEETEVSGEHQGDFVWAFRLSRVASGYFSERVHVEPYKEGAVLAQSDRTTANAILSEEGLLHVLGNDMRVLEAYSGEGDNLEQHFFVSTGGFQEVTGGTSRE